MTHCRDWGPFMHERSAVPIIKRMKLKVEPFDQIFFEFHSGQNFCHPVTQKIRFFDDTIHLLITRIKLVTKERA